jgi:hypothetical protein
MCVTLPGPRSGSPTGHSGNVSAAGQPSRIHRLSPLANAPVAPGATAPSTTPQPSQNLPGGDPSE